MDIFKSFKKHKPKNKDEMEQEQQEQQQQQLKIDDSMFHLTNWMTSRELSWEMFRANPDSGLCFSLEQLQILQKLYFEIENQLKDYWVQNQSKLEDKDFENFIDFQHKFDQYYDGITLGRFLVARNFDLDDTMQMIIEDFEWRTFEVEMDKFMDQYPKSDWAKFIASYYPNVCHGVDRYGVEVNWEKVTLLDIDSFFKYIPFSEILSHHIFSVESSERRVRKKMKETKNYCFRRLLIEDLEGLSMKHFTPKVIELLKISAEIDEKHYPESLRQLYFIRAGPVFSVFWNGIVPFLNKTTSKKLVKIDSSKLIASLLEQVPDQTSWPITLLDSILDKNADHKTCKYECKIQGCLPLGGEFPINQIPSSKDDILHNKKKHIFKIFKKKKNSNPKNLSTKLLK